MYVFMNVCASLFIWETYKNVKHKHMSVVNVLLQKTQSRRDLMDHAGSQNCERDVHVQSVRGHDVYIACSLQNV